MTRNVEMLKNAEMLKNEGEDGAPTLASRVRSHLETLYPQDDRPQDDRDGSAAQDDLAALTAAVLEVMQLDPGSPADTHNESLWSEKDAVLITYADTITEPDKSPLSTLREVLPALFGGVAGSTAGGAFSVLHLLPFFVASSDGGFAVSDHQAVAPWLGDWDDVVALADRYKLMVDLVCGHVSKSHRWVSELAAGVEPGSSCLMTASPADDLSAVVRPRTHDLLQPIDTPAGVRHLWCTFSHDQVDIDYHQPEALLELLRILKTLLDHGANWVRLDAIAYLWKELGTSCIHLPQVHEVVKLLRLLLDAHGDAAGGKRPVLITETNVAHADNISYFGNKSNVVYNFTLAPLLVHTFLSGSSAQLQRWVSEWTTNDLAGAHPGTTYLNFIASHDGIGLRSVEGLLSADEMQQMIDAADASGGTHSHYDTPDGKSPYELNVALFDLIVSPNNHLGVEHYLAMHDIMLELAGVPAFYIHSMLCTPGFFAESTRADARIPRNLNRQKLLASDIDEMLDGEDGLRRNVLNELLRRVEIRRNEPAFHPNAPQRSLPVNDGVFGLVRGEAVDSGTSNKTVVCLTNVSDEPQEIEHASIGIKGDAYDLLSASAISASNPLPLAAGQTVWLN